MTTSGGTEHPREGYYDREHLRTFGEIGQARGELAAKFFDWYGAVMGEGALTKREKSLIALAVSHAVQCPYCIDAYSKNCLEAGADQEQMTEAVHVAAAIRGGATLVHGRQMQEHANRLSM
jgi:alkylhydroperoxidase/carboxymuconolactone decarboxylase family protein